jgi:hypothetical protein
MKKLTPQQMYKIDTNLNKFFDAATDDDIKYGLSWYQDAHQTCLDMAARYNTTTDKVAGVISALSPRNKWEQNIKDAYTVFQAIHDGKQPVDVKVCTFHSNKFKAFAIARGEVKITDESLKTFNFVNNIAHLDDTMLTVDIWHLRACFNQMFKIDSASIGRLAYEQIKSLTIRKAKKIGIKGYQYQAIIWASIRNSNS